MTAIQAGLELMGYGLIGVFGTLILFYIVIKVMMNLSGKRKRE